VSRDSLLLLEDIVESCAKIRRYTGELSRDAVLADEMRFDGILRNLQVIGEAVKKLPPGLRERHADVPWRKIAGLRDFVSHVSRECVAFRAGDRDGSEDSAR
jgi:uncharacterized protein with HEPN domain